MKLSSLLLTVFILLVISFVLINLAIKKPYSTKFEDIRRICCAECLSAFSQSPVGVGPQAARCGGFSSALDIGEECDAYFKTNPMTVEKCQEFA